MKQKITGADYPGENIHYLNRIQLMISILYIENTSWKVLAYGIYARVVDVSEIERMSAANKISDTKTTSA